MPRVSLAGGGQSVNSLPDLISTEAYYLDLGAIPGGPQAPDQMGIKILNANIPGFSNETMEANLHGHVVKFRGRKMYPRTLSVTYVEDMTFATLNNLRRWHEFIVGTESANSQGDKADYAVDAKLEVYDHKGVVINTLTFYSLFPQDIPDVQLSGESSTLMQVPITFNYDYFTASGHPTL